MLGSLIIHYTARQNFIVPVFSTPSSIASSTSPLLDSEMPSTSAKKAFSLTQPGMPPRCGNLYLSDGLLMISGQEFLTCIDH